MGHLAAYQRANQAFLTHVLHPKLKRLDKEASAKLKLYIVSSDIDYQLAPPHIHQRNSSEHEILNFKNHLLDILIICNRRFPINLWDRLLD